jgi:hypothetical protein
VNIRQGTIVSETTGVKSDGRESPDFVVVDLRDPWLAAVLAWLVPGAGHLYQGRIAKAILFFVSIVGTFAFGMYLGGGHVVYASLRAEDRRLPYFCQVGVGLPALPALVQAERMRGPTPKAPFWNSPTGAIMAPPRLPGQIVPRGSIADRDSEDVRIIPEQYSNNPEAQRQYRERYVVNRRDELHDWNLRFHSFFELGTVYTMIAGLLNVLAIYDAFSGPLLILPPEEDDKEPRKKPTD